MNMNRCQPVADISSSMVVPLGARFNSAIMASVSKPERL